MRIDVKTALPTLVGVGAALAPIFGVTAPSVEDQASLINGGLALVNVVALIAAAFGRPLFGVGGRSDGA